jgi:hypothetical protein|tara:strand:- start:84 stop:281 length:198 start_codon:yes stop_codon:yes gene_type:complete
METTTIIISIILAIIWVFIIFEIYNAKEFNDLYKHTPKDKLEIDINQKEIDDQLFYHSKEKEDIK